MSGLVVTGASGFIGRAVVAAAHAPVTRVAWPLEDAASWRRAMALAGGAPTVIHAAFPGRVTWNEIGEGGLRCFAEATSLALLEAWRDFPAARVVLLSTAAVYASAEGPVAEDARVGPTTPYGRAKLRQEALLSAAAPGPLVIARVFNAIGPGQPRGYLAQDLIDRVRLARDGDSLAVGPLGTERDYVDVGDVAQILLSSHLMGCVNIGTGVGTVGLELARLIAEHLGRTVTFAPSALDGGVQRSIADTARLRSFGLTAPTTVARALERQCAAGVDTPDAPRYGVAP